MLGPTVDCCNRDGSEPNRFHSSIFKLLGFSVLKFMMPTMDIKRLFFGMEVVSLWPEDWPAGRVLLEPDRHLTLAFLGDNHLPALMSRLETFPDPGFQIGVAAIFDRPVFLPQREPRTAGWHVHFLEQKGLFIDFQKRLIVWLKEQGLSPRENHDEFLPHVTIARAPFVINEWKEAFVKRPLFLKNIHLCESLGSSRYQIHWSYPMIAPFEAIEHTADLAFLVRGQNYSELFLHASLALSFEFLPLIQYVEPISAAGINEVVMSLNELIARVDENEGCSFKAVSLHSQVCQKAGSIMEWEMIVDV